ncbi:MAG: DUF1622 domain-containing protein, partial [Waterburya sp.]
MKREPLRESLINLILPLTLIFGLVALLSLNTGQVVGERQVISPLEGWLKVIVGYLTVGTEIAAAIIIGSAVVRGLTLY